MPSLCRVINAGAGAGAAEPAPRRRRNSNSNRKRNLRASLVTLASLSTLANAAAPLEPTDGSVLLGAWYDRINGDTPAAINGRIKSKSLSFFQTDIDLSGRLKPLTGPNITTQFMQQLVESGTDADAYMTVYPFEGYDKVTDAQISDFTNRMADIIKTGRNVFIRYAPEMNGNWFPYGQDPEAFITSWRRFYTSVKSGLGSLSANVAFIWSPNSGNGYPYPGGISYPSSSNPADAARIRAMDTNGNGQLDRGDDPYRPYYPGDDFVDWIGMSIYHYGSSWPWHDNVVPPANAFRSYLDGTVSGDTGNFHYYNMYPNKPVFISETGATFHVEWLDPSSQSARDLGPIDTTSVSRVQIKQAWWREFLDPAFFDSYPRVKAIGTFEFVKDEELTMRDFTMFGAPPNGYPEDADVVAAFQADIASGPYGRNIRWASAASVVDGGGSGGAGGGGAGGNSSTNPSSTQTVTTKSDSAGTISIPVIVPLMFSALCVGMLSVFLA